MNQKLPLHRGSVEWQEEKRITEQIPGWSDILLDRVKRRLGPYASWVKHVGRGIGEIQFQFDDPIEKIIEYPDRNITWVQFATYESFTKRKGKRTIRYSSNTGTLVLLVRSPNPSDPRGYDYFLLARKKYQPVPQMRMVEFSRGWIEGKENADIGWGLFERDFPGLKGASFVNKIWHSPLGSYEIYANDAEFANYHHCHLIVVTLNQAMSKSELYEYLVGEKIKKDYSNKTDEYPDLSVLSGKDLESEPIVMSLNEAAEIMNAHLENSPDSKPWLFKEEFSMNCWTRFKDLCHDQFPELLPKQLVIPE